MRKKIIIILVLSFIAAALMEALAWTVDPANVPMPVMPENAENLDLAAASYTSGYDQWHTTYIPNNDDPQIGFVFPGRDIATIYIELKKPLTQDMAVQIYYAIDGNPLNEANSVKFWAKRGSDILCASLPRDTYTHIRLDINGKFSLGGIYTSNDEEAKIEYIKAPPQISRFFLGWLSLLIIGGGCCITWDTHIHIGLAGRIKPSKPRKGLLIFAAVYIFGVLLLFQVNFSNMGNYCAMIPNNIAASGARILGEVRPIRSDEYLVSTPAFFHDSINGQLPVQAIAEDNNSVVVLINNLITRLNPYYWGELYLPASYAFSWNALFMIFFALYSFYRLFQIITGNQKFSALASFLLAFAPGFQWWFGPGQCGMWCGLVVFFYDFFCANKMWQKLLYAWGLVCCTSVVVPSLYPAWDIPYVYLFLLIVIGIYATKKRIDFKKTDIPYIAVTCALMAIVVGAYFISSGDTTESMLATIYPGRRFSAGGNLQSSYWTHYLAAPLTPWKSDNIFMNQSELSDFLHLFPIPMAMFIAKYQDFKDQKTMKALVCFNILCDIYMIFGVGNFIATYTLLSYTTSKRLHLIWGVSSFILLLLECNYIVPQKARDLKKNDWIRCIFVNGCVIAFLIWTVIRQKPIINYIGASNFVYFSVGVILLGNLLFFGKKKIFITIMCILTVISGLVVNPINLGTDIMTNTPLAREVREIDSRDSGKWIAIDDIWMPKYIYAQGVDCLNYLSWPPRFDLFEPLDENGEFRDIYNRYAHVAVSLTEENTSFALNETDALTVFLNIADMQKWDVKYVVARREMPERIGNVEFGLLYYDFDNVHIYEVEYYTE